MIRDDIEYLLDEYMKGLVSGDMSNVPLSEEVIFRSPYMGHVSGADAVAQVLRGAAQLFTGLKLHPGARIVDGSAAFLVFDVELPGGALVALADLFRFAEGKVVYLQPFFDTRAMLPLIEAFAAVEPDAESEA